MKLLLCTVVLLCISLHLSEALNAGCPLSSQMTSCQPKCKDDTECHGQKCCPNICNAKSCTQPNQNKNSNKYSGSSSAGGAGSYCGNVKCNSYEKCDVKKNRCVNN